MRGRERYNLAMSAAEATYHLWELESQQEGPDLERMMRRLKDLSAYSLTHAEIMEQREGVELLALAMFFGATSEPSFHKNQERLRQLSEETVAYQGRAEIVEEQVARRKSGKPVKRDEETNGPLQPRLL
jgi:hypothetical protein